MQRFTVAVLGGCAQMLSLIMLSLSEAAGRKSIQLTVSYRNGGFEAEKMSGCLECDGMRWMCAYACSKQASAQEGGRGDGMNDECPCRVGDWNLRRKS